MPIPFASLLFAALCLAPQASAAAQSQANPHPQSATQPSSSPAVAPPREDPAITALALKIYAQMRSGKVDDTLLTPEMNKALTPEVLAGSQPVFAQLGEPTRLTLQTVEPGPGGLQYTYLATFPTAQFHVRILVTPEGKVGGYLLKP